MSKTETLHDPARLTASIFSTVFSPLLVPTYGVMLVLWTSALLYLPASTRWSVTLVVFATTCILPMLAIVGLWKMRYISDPQLNTRTERSVPYIITGVCYLACGFYLWRLHAPIWLWSLPVGGAIAVAICLIVNRWWKISAHMAAMGGLVAIMFRLQADHVNAVSLGVWIPVVVLLAGLVGSSRVLLERHTLWQVIAGFTAGFLSVFLLSMC